MEIQSGRHVNIEQLVDRRVGDWARQQQLKSPKLAVRSPIPGPYVAISRAIGTHGRRIAKAIADCLSWEYYEREVVDYIAERAQVRQAVVKSLGETRRDAVDNWVRGMMDHGVLSEDAYARHLVFVIGAIAAHGQVVILGRGAQFILPPETGLRIRLVAPHDYRVRAAMEDYGMPEGEAEKLIRGSDKAQKRFYHHYFRKDVHDPLAYDMMLNCSTIQWEQAVDAIACAVRSKLGREAAEMAQAQH